MESISETPVIQFIAFVLQFNLILNPNWQIHLPSSPLRIAIIYQYYCRDTKCIALSLFEFDLPAVFFLYRNWNLFFCIPGKFQIQLSNSLLQLDSRLLTRTLMSMPSQLEGRLLYFLQFMAEFLIYFINHSLSDKQNQLMNSSDAFAQFLRETLGHDFDYSSVWPWAEKEFGLNQPKQIEFSMNQCAFSYENIKNKYRSNLIADWPHEWHKNEKKLYVQVLLCFCKSQKKLPLEMNEKDWEYLSTVLFNKNPMFLKFQAFEQLKLQKKLQWSVQDDKLISEYVEKCSEGNWSQISKLIFYKTGCGKFFSTKQIRERWNNHVRSSLDKGPWTNEEDILLLEHVLYRNKRWSEINKMFGKKRTEHMIKNRFNFLTIKYARHQLKKPSRILKLLEQIKQKESVKRTEEKQRTRGIRKGIKKCNQGTKAVQNQEENKAKPSKSEGESQERNLSGNLVGPVQQVCAPEPGLQQNGYSNVGALFMLPVQANNISLNPTTIGSGNFPYVCMAVNPCQLNLSYNFYNASRLIYAWPFNYDEQQKKTIDCKQWTDGQERQSGP